MTVYVVQNTHRRDRTNGTWVPKFDLSTAEQFGELEYLLEPNLQPFDLPPIVQTLQEKLADFDGLSDYLLLIGSPVLIGLAVAIAADRTDGHVAMLQWSGQNHCYFPARVFNLFEECSHEFQIPAEND
jgi:hypothetical protein